MLLAAGCKLAAGGHAPDAGATAPAITLDLPHAATKCRSCSTFRSTRAGRSP
jgi:hypothetical protein